MNGLLVPLLLFALSCFAAAQDVGTLTMRDGGVRVIRGIFVLQPAEGMRLRQGDIFETSESAFAQLEFFGGGILALGPSSRMYLLSTGHGGSKGRTELILLSGWLKGQTGSSAGTYQYLSPALAATTRDGTLVMHAAPELAEVFVESGAAALNGEGRSSRDSKNGKAGQFFFRPSGKTIVAASGIPESFVQSMPNQFKDTFPPLAYRFAGKKVEPQPEHEVSYAEVQSWLTMNPAWRTGFVHRFQPRLKDPAFRKSVDAHLAQHPEWDPALHPEKYQRATPTTATDNAGQRERYPQ
jgi:hypothetical protein